MVFNSPGSGRGADPARTGERTDDGRPRVADNFVERRYGYNFQFEGNWFNLRPELTMAGPP